MDRHIILFIFMILLPIGAKADKSLMSGLFLHYEGAEYESSFIPCKSKEIIYIKNGDAFKELINLYKTTNKSKHGEIFVSIEVNTVEINKQKYSNSHYSGVATVSKIFESSGNINKIEKCRNQ